MSTPFPCSALRVGSHHESALQWAITCLVETGFWHKILFLVCFLPRSPESEAFLSGQFVALTLLLKDST